MAGEEAAVGKYQPYLQPGVPWHRGAEGPQTTDTPEVLCKSDNTLALPGKRNPHGVVAVLQGLSAGGGPDRF